MKFDIPKIVRSVAMSGYAPELGELVFYVWVNPPAKLLREHDSIIADLKTAISQAVKEEIPDELLKRIDEGNDRIFEIYSQLWSQGPEDCRWIKDELKSKVQEFAETDPQWWPWMRRRTLDEIGAYRTAIKKD